MLYAVAVLDELASGVPSAGAPDIQRSFGLSYSATTVVVFLVPGIVGLIVEPFVFLLADRYPRKWFVGGGLAVMSLASFAAALAPGPTMLAFAIAIWGVASGSATALSQATLVDRHPDKRARIMARWTLCSYAGDLLAPILLATLATLALGWRTGFAIVGGVIGVFCIAVLCQRFDGATAVSTGGHEGDDEKSDEKSDTKGDTKGESDDGASYWSRLRGALRDRTLILWLLGTALCDLLDEILVVFAALHVRNELGASHAWLGIILGAFMIGGAIGLVVLERLLARHSEQRLLVITALACAMAYSIWLLVPTLTLSAMMMFVVGATAAPLYPLAAARAYARCPGRSGLVLAASHLFTPLGLALPFLLGIVADAAGTHVALALLVVQPLGLAWLASRRAEAA